MSTVDAGLRLRQRYVLRARLGAGGMSEVWSADDEVLRRPVAVKVLSPRLADDPALRAGIRVEARAAAGLDHPHITRVYDYGATVLPDGTHLCYLVMELVEGQTLAARLALGPLPWPAAVQLTAQVAAALAVAHRAGLVHRDVKPGNVMLTPAGAKVLDFGIAAVARPTRPQVGTPAYAAPEWLVAAAPDPAADVYGLGALLYEALTDQPAVRARSWDEAAETHLRGSPLPLPDAPGLPPRVAGLCLACLAPNPRRRPEAADVAAELDAIHLAQATSQRDRSAPAGYSRQNSSGARSWRTGLALTAAVAAGALALALASAALLDRDATARDTIAAPPTATGPPSTLTSPDGPVASPPPEPGSSPTAVVNEFERRLAEAAAGGQVRSDVVIDLRNELNALRQRIDQGRSADLRGPVVDLRRKLADRLAEQAIEPRTAAQLTALLDRLA